ncbi:MAG: caspase family protein [Pseudomonadota bacterium]
MRLRTARRAGISGLAGLALVMGGFAPAPLAAQTTLSAESYQVVDCLLPGQVRKLGRATTFITPRRPVRTSAITCEIRGGEYVAADRATFASSMAVWLPSAKEGDPKAQAYVGRIYAEGFDLEPNHAQAAVWYQKAADQGYAPAMIDLGQLYERGLGVPKDPVKAVNLYRRATGLPPNDFAAAATVAGSDEVARLNARYEAARADAEALTRELEASRRALAEERAALAKAQADLQKAGSANRAADARAADVAALQAQLAALTAELEAARTQAAQARQPAPQPSVSPAQLKAAQAERTQAIAQRDRLQQELAALRAQLPGAQTKLADLELEAAQARRQAAQANARLNEALAALQARDDQLAAARARLAEEKTRAGSGDQAAAARLRSAQADYDRLAQDLDRARGDAEARRAEIAAAQKALEAREAEMAQARATAAAAEARLAKAEADLRDRDQRLKSAESRLAAAEGRASQVQRDYDAASRRSAELAAQVASLQKDLEAARKGQGTVSADLKAREARLAQREAKIQELENRLSSAVGAYRNASATSISRSRPTRMPASSKFGFSTNYALLIGESDYKDPRLGKLATPANDVTQLGAILRSRYGFNVNVVLDKTRAEILKELDALAQKVGENDTLLIYYAGHGGMEKVRNGEDRGYWLPIDAEYGSSAGQISNQEITYQVARMAARKVLIIADSCYSGLLTQTVTRAQRPMTADEKTNEYLIGMAWKQSRNVLTSGRLEPVLDGGGGEHSVFAAALLEVLRGNNDVMTSEEVYSRLLTRVMARATRVLLDERDTPDPQQPTYAALDNGGHVYGDFLFVPRTNVAMVGDR